MKKIVLASRSIDRRELFKRIKVPHEILITDIDESKFKKVISDPIELVRELAKSKVLKAKKMLSNTPENVVIIAADTVVEFDDKIIGKAQNSNEAFHILNKLSGKSHNLLTGFAISETNNPKIVIDYDNTTVTFLPLLEQDIKKYVESKEWKGRAGAYSILDKAALFVDSIQGSPSNVIGLPMHKIYTILKSDFNIDLMENF